MAYKFNPFTGKLDNTGPSVSALNVLGTVANEAALPGSATTGDVYQAEDTGVFYVWDGSAWDDLGTLVGPAGPTGATGPTGPAGADGVDGTDGADGADGVGIPVGGTTNQVLAKASNTNYDTQWVDQTGAGGTPGGTTGQIQFNDNGSFGGATGSVVDSSGNVTIGGLTTLAGSPSANNTSGVLINGTWRTGASSNNPQLLLNPSGTTLSTTWSTSGTGIGVNAASGFGGNLLDLQVNGSSKVKFDASDERFVFSNGSRIGLNPNGVIITGSSATGGLVVYSDGVGTLGTDGRILVGSANDVQLYRDASNTFAQRRGANAQTFRVYGTESSSLANYVRASLSSTSTAVTLAAETAGTGADDVPLNLTAAGTGTVKVNSVAEVAVSSTVAGLPASPVVGMLTRVTDGDSGLTFGNTVVNSGAGATPYLVWYNGTNWTVIGA